MEKDIYPLCDSSIALQRYIKQNIELKERIKTLETLLPVVKQNIRAVTISEANDAMLALITALKEVEPSYFITAKEWLKNPTFDNLPETDGNDE